MLKNTINGIVPDTIITENATFNQLNEGIKTVGNRGTLSYRFEMITRSCEWKAPENLASKVAVRIFGGGGGGGGSADGYCSGGGGGGGHMSYSEITLTPGIGVSITIGNGGLFRNGGSSSSFGTLLSANGGSAGGNAGMYRGGTGGSGGSGGGGGGTNWSSDNGSGGGGGTGAYGGRGGNGTNRNGTAQNGSNGINIVDVNNPYMFLGNAIGGTTTGGSSGGGGGGGYGGEGMNGINAPAGGGGGYGGKGIEGLAAGGLGSQSDTSGGSGGTAGFILLSYLVRVSIDEPLLPI